MNPFALSGPAFLAFYILFGTAVCVCLQRWLARMETREDLAQPTLVTDPYLIAFLRGGPDEAVKVATVSLVDRGLLTYGGVMLRTASAEAEQLVQRGIEREILAHYRVADTPQGIVARARLLPSCLAYRRELERRELLANGVLIGRRVGPALVALAALFACAGAKTVYALAHGHRNLAFLFMLAAGFSVHVMWQLFRSRTGRGAARLADLRILFERLKTRSHRLEAGGATNEMALTAAVFGLYVLPAATFPYVTHMYRPAAGDSGSGASGDSGGSSCSSGSSCGGGGGCGGCGG